MAKTIKSTSCAVIPALSMAIFAASIAIMQVAKAFSVLRGRNFVIPEDILMAVNPVLRHRVSLTPEREMEGASTDDVLKEIIGRMEIPR